MIDAATAARPINRLLCGSVLMLALAACATNPVTGDPNFVLMTENEELQLGRTNDPKIREHYGVYDDAALQAYVQQVGERVAAHGHRPELVYRFTVLDTPDVNAFALPGGYIYITRGILAYLNSEAELAAVLGHEIGHVTARHSVRQYSAATAGQVLASILLRSPAGQNLFNVIGNALLSGYGRDHELEADRLGAQYIARTGYDPGAMIDVIGVLKNQEEFEKVRAKAEHREPHNYHGVFASHPSADQRLQEVVAEADKDKTNDATRRGQDAYLKHIDGLVFGDSARTGVRRGSGFYHRDLDFAVQFPDGWHLDNSADAVTAISPDQDGVVALRTEVLNKRSTPEEYLKARLKISELENGAPLSGVAFPSFSGLTPLKTPFGQRNARVSVIYRNKRAFLFLAAGKTDILLAHYDAAFLATARSLHPLTAAEKTIAEGLRVHVIETATGQRFAQLARTSPITNYAESVLRLLNDKFPSGEPAPGEAIKIIQ